jgi:hypothetical protein
MELLDLVITDWSIRNLSFSERVNVHLLINVSSNISLAVFMIAGTGKLVGVPDQVYIQCRHNQHVLR